MIPVYCIGEEVEREEAWRQIAEAVSTGEELVTLWQAIRDWDRTVALLRRPAVNDNKPRAGASGAQAVDLRDPQGRMR